MEKTFCSFYYQVCPSDNTELKLEKANTALLVIDLQRVYTKLADKDQRWNAFSKRLNETVFPNVKKIEALFRKNKQDVIFARIACHLKDGRDRSLSQKMSGWNNILITLDDDDSQIIDDIAPVNDEIVVTKTTDSALTGTNLRLILNNLGIKTVVCAGIFTDQCVASTVRSLSDESFNVVVLEDACAAGTMELHNAELTIINNIYAKVCSTDDLIKVLSSN